MVHPSAYLTPGVTLIGNVELDEESSVWFNSVLRGDINLVRLGKRSNVQDNCVLHVTKDLPMVVGDDVSYGHNVTTHGCTIGNRVLLGIGCVVLDGAVIGDDSIVGAGAVVAPGTVVPPRSLVLGTPGKVVKSLDDRAVEGILRNARNYVGYCREYVSEGIGEERR
jgi:carbonic anhydrase/acetyltransferase-like protein (isoleucine patch superfamily)